MLFTVASMDLCVDVCWKHMAFLSVESKLIPCLSLLVCIAFAVSLNCLISIQKFSHFFSSNFLPYPSAGGGGTSK